jgi:heptaprenyl diphosphate synthase
MKKSPISSFVRQQLKLVEDQLLNTTLLWPSSISSIISELLKAGGKRLRPVLVILSSMVGDYDSVEVMPGCLAVEFIHLASLIHDDVLDKASFRRGKPSVSFVHGHRLAVAIGDYLFGQAFYLVAAKNDGRLFPPLSQACLSLSRGELLQRDSAGSLEQTEAEYLEKIYCKTAALFKSACQIGALLGKVDGSAYGTLASYGENLGMAFQIYDDILDFIGNDEDLGKPLGADISNGTITLPVIYAIQDRSCRRQLRKILNGKLPLDKAAIEKATTLIKSTNAIERTKQRAKYYAEKAMLSAEQLSKHKARKDLISIGNFVINRCN